MKYVFLITVITVLSFIQIYEQQTGTMTDSRNGKVYKTIKIGNQWWMAENLAYKTNSGCWAYDNDEYYVAKYGYLYNWEVAKNICPNGYHLPSDNEWEKLTLYINTSKGPFTKSGNDWFPVGKYLKATSGWKSSGNGIDEFNFTAYPGGRRKSGGHFCDVLVTGYWWSNTSNKNTTAWYRCLHSYSKGFYNDDEWKEAGFSVRCVKN